MVRTASTMLPLSTDLPDFALPNVDGSTVSAADYRGRPLLVMFLCNHCPFVKHLRAALAEFGRECEAAGLAVVAISSNDVAAQPEDSPELMKVEAREAGYVFPYLFDESQSVAKRFRAACTPDFFLFDAAGKLAYRGQFDDSRPGNGKPITGADLRSARDAVLAGRPVSEPQRASIGCNIKWQDAPDYFTGVRAEE